ncbi:MAG: tRNA lysidine(34) synthetase TilS [Arcobacteraceae bacterium]|jgi:tRNA(Ile)-lysidine synthase|nr:tRNA lysidine(34) synthetase TilS [Arcobacteraceae bacterium]
MITQNLITTTKNLLAFSGGVDSTALFFLLTEQKIPFDICIVNYHQREQSELEVVYAKEIASKYGKVCFVEDYSSDTFSEKDARDFRYEVFSSIIKKYHYQSLITAHQLNDKFEWFLMQLSKGAGLMELIGIQKVEKRENFTLYRPLLENTKEELLEYLERNNLHYFIDETNKDTKYKRNFFRKEFSDKFIHLYQEGLKKSFHYLEKDIQSLMIDFKKFEFEELTILRFVTLDENIMIRAIDKELKKRGIVISQKTREEIISKKSLVVSHTIAIEIRENFVWIAPMRESIMDKKFKEKCRIAKVPKYIRPYLFQLPNQEETLHSIKTTI